MSLCELNSCLIMLFVSDYQSQRSSPRDWSRIFVSFILIVRSFSCLEIVEQLSLEVEPKMDEFDHYLQNYVGDNTRLALLLDYDGTLAPIAAHPDLTDMSEATKNSLNKITKNSNIFTAVISGRAVDNVKGKIDIEGIVYAGNHGLEILYPNGTRYNHQIPGNISGNYSKMVEALEKVRKLI